MYKKIEPYKDIARIYDEIRPSYPEELIQDIITATNIGPNSSLLEIGAGTGKATVQFADKGFKIHAIELGKDMGNILKQKCRLFPGVSIEITSFEEWAPKDNDKYDVVFCAQAFHWLDITVKYKKCYDLLKKDGYLVLFWYNSSGDETVETRTINQKVDEIIQKCVAMQPVEKKQERAAHSGVFDNDERKAEIEDSELFEISDIFQYRTEIKNNAEQYLKASKSVPAYASILDGLSDKAVKQMEAEITREIVNNGGYVGTIFDYSLYIAKKVAK